MDERRIAQIAFRFATRRLVDYDRIIAALPAPPVPERPSLPPRAAPLPAGAERIYLMPDI